MLIFVILVLVIFVTVIASHREKFTLGTVQKYIINLESRPDRMQVTIPLLKNFGYTRITRFDATSYNPDLLKLVHKDHIGPIIAEKRTKHHELSKGAVGCYLSHISIYEKLLQTTDSDMFMIFEDDVLPSDTIQVLEKEVAMAPKDWDILLIGGIYSGKDTFPIVKVGSFYQLHAYIIKKNAVEKILNKCYPIMYQIDSFLSDMSENNELNVYGLNKMDWGINHQVSRTDIQTPILTELR
jgi:GR25 family glycosyltransferase involved in LPS biosynthesis